MSERFTSTVKALQARRESLARERAEIVAATKTQVSELDVRLAAIDRVLVVLRENQTMLEPLLNELIAAGLKVGT